MVPALDRQTPGQHGSTTVTSHLLGIPSPANNSGVVISTHARAGGDIQGGALHVTALTGPTEEAQFYDEATETQILRLEGKSGGYHAPA